MERQQSDALRRHPHLDWNQQTSMQHNCLYAKVVDCSLPMEHNPILASRRCETVANLLSSAKAKLPNVLTISQIISQLARLGALMASVRDGARYKKGQVSPRIYGFLQHISKLEMQVTEDTYQRHLSVISPVPKASQLQSYFYQLHNIYHYGLLRWRSDLPNLRILRRA